MAVLYYIYVRESAEESSYLPEIPGLQLMRIKYLPAESAFIHPVYEDCAAYVVNSAFHTDEEEAEIKRCISKGHIRSDWLLPRETLIELIDNASSTHERNYYLVMKKIKDRYSACIDLQ